MHPIQQSEDDQLVDAEIMFGSVHIGRVQGVIRDPLSNRVRRLITTYGPARRRVAVPMEWVVLRSPSRLVLGVGAHSLDDLADQADSSPVSSATAAAAGSADMYDRRRRN